MSLKHALRSRLPFGTLGARRVRPTVRCKGYNPAVGSTRGAPSRMTGVLEAFAAPMCRPTITRGVCGDFAAMGRRS